MTRSRLFSERGIVHGYSTRDETREQFLQTVLGKSYVTTAAQVHGIKIARVTSTVDHPIPGYDGLVSHGIPIGVTFADCVPILVADTKNHIIGVAHAGWKGTVAGIAKELIAAMIDEGARSSTMVASIGPHIGMCCYSVAEERATLFTSTFGHNEKIASYIQGTWHLDIGYANYQLLIDAGLSRDQIDAPPYCTSCQHEIYNSFRADTKSEFGLQLGVLAL